ncbi:MAG: GrpB family protein [Phormidesmis sp.]
MSEQISSRIIEVVEYQPSWVDEFQNYAKRLHQSLDGLIIGVEHVGSTSVTGLAAKPIIDIDIVISSRVVLGRVLQRLATIGYKHIGNDGIPGREALGWPGERRHHLYVCAVNAPNLHNHLIFRDYLREHPEVADAYGQLKKRLAQQYKRNAESYCDAKTEFIQQTVETATAQYSDRTFQPRASTEN